MAYMQFFLTIKCYNDKNASRFKMNKLKTIIKLIPLIFTFTKPDSAVTLTESQIQFRTFRHAVGSDYSLQNDTFSSDIVNRTYKSLIIENEYLKVTLVPDWGGRIISMIYKPTGHEQLYQNPVGRPYGPQWDAFYYDWLMLWGGIFPTFPEPEHGKAWCRPWVYAITSNTPKEVSVKMTFTDTINYPKHPPQFKYGITYITCNFEVSLEAGTSALKTSVSLVNPNNNDVSYEYWTNVGAAPGSDPGKTRCDDQTEIVGPISTVKISTDWADIRKVEQPLNNDMFRFEKLRWYKNWTNDGIVYAWPVNGNFWGALNHKNKEAIIRIADNTKTPGLKLWGFGYNQSRSVNPENPSEYRRPFIEMWAGVSKEFFTPAILRRRDSLQFDEYYTPTVGLNSFTHANKYAVVNISTDKSKYDGNVDRQVAVSCGYFVTRPADTVTIRIRFRGNEKYVTIYEVTTSHQTGNPYNEIFRNIPVKDLCSDIKILSFEILSADRVLINAEMPVSISNAGTCDVSSCRETGRYTINKTSYKPFSFNFYTINGTYFGTGTQKNSVLLSKPAVFLAIDNNGICKRMVMLQGKKKKIRTWNSEDKHLGGL